MLRTLFTLVVIIGILNIIVTEMFTGTSVLLFGGVQLIILGCLSIILVVLFVSLVPRSTPQNPFYSSWATRQSWPKSKARRKQRVKNISWERAFSATRKRSWKREAMGAKHPEKICFVGIKWRRSWKSLSRCCLTVLEDKAELSSSSLLDEGPVLIKHRYSVRRNMVRM